MSLVGRTYYGCSNRRNKGTCKNHLTIRLDVLEEAALYGQKEQLVTPQLTKEFIREYSLEINRLKAEASSQQEAARDILNNLNAKIDNIVDAIAAGNTSNALTERLEKLEREKEHVLSNLDEAEPDPVRIHPNAADLYIAKVGNLRQALNKGDSRSEAAQILRFLMRRFDCIRLTGNCGSSLLGFLLD